MNYDLIFFPDYRVANPYQRLLYDRLGRLHPRSGTIDDALRLLDRAGQGQRVIFHLHWEDTIHRHIADPALAGRAVEEFLGKVDDFVGRGGTLVWTVHNQGSHVAAHPELDRKLRFALGGLADAVHVHSLSAAGFIRRDLDLGRDKLVVLPHGNYLPIHDRRSIEREAERAGRNWLAGDIVLLLFGRLDSYKGASDLLDAFHGMAAPARLVIAGKQVEPIEARLGQLASEVRARISLLDGFVPDAQVAALFAAADAVVLPSCTVLTSGTLMLALSLGRPVIAPDLPAMADVVRDGREAVLYPHDRPGGLRLALDRFAAMGPADRSAMADAALATAKIHDWRWIGRQFVGALVEAAEHGRAVRRAPAVTTPSADPA